MTASPPTSAPCARPLSVVLAGGGTAGHIEPALAVADALRRRDPATRITALGTERGLETRLVPERGYALALIPAVPIPRRPSVSMLSLPSRLRGAVRAVEAVLQQVEADVLVGFGGYVAGPAYLGARAAHVPYVVHEANARAGLANRLGARFTPFVASGWPHTKLPHARYLGIPLRAAISGLDRMTERTAAREHFGLAADLPTLLVTGGSQGAKRLNEAMTGAAASVGASGVQVLHITGPQGAAEVVDVPGYVALAYCDRMDLAYAAADLALVRAGALTCTELAAVGLPAVFVPLPIGNGEQRLNAEPLVEAGGALLVDDAECTAAWLARTVPPLVLDVPRLDRMASAAATLGRRDADERLADLVIEAAAAMKGRNAE